MRVFRRSRGRAASRQPGAEENLIQDSHVADSDVEILTTILATDYSSNESSQQATTAIVGIVIAYLGASLFVLDKNEDLSVGLVLLLPLPVILLQMLQMTWAVAVIRRAKSAELVEAELMKRTALAARYESGEIGSVATTSVTDISHPRAKGAMKAVGLTGQLPYYGFYALTLAFTCFAFSQAAGGVDVNLLVTSDRLTLASFGVLYFALFMIFAIAASVGFGIARPRNLVFAGIDRFALVVQIGAALVALVGLFLQFVQTADPTPMFEYFTIWSALGVVVFVPSSMLLDSLGLEVLALTAVIGSTISGLVYLIAIQPVNGLGGDVLIQAANIILHHILLVLCASCLVFSHLVFPRISGLVPRSRRAAAVLVTLAFPILYAVVVLVVELITGLAGVYQFLRVGTLSANWAYLGLFLVVWCGLPYLGVLLRYLWHRVVPTSSPS